MDYDRRFYEGQSAGSYASAGVVVPLVQKLVDVKSVCDIGCGIGTWLRCWREHGVSDVLGIDGQYVNTSQLMFPLELFRPGNLRDPIICTRRFDLVMSLEVAEHLPPESTRLCC